MSGLKKTKTAAVPASETDQAVDEFDKIMSEIEELQEEIGTETRAAKEISTPQAAPPRVHPIPAPTPPMAASPVEEDSSDSAPEAVPSAGSHETPAHLHDLRSEEGSVDLEETLAGLKEDEPPTGKTLFDEVTHDEAVADELAAEEAVAEEAVAEEAVAEEAVAEEAVAEEAVAQESVEDSVDESSPMQEAEVESLEEFKMKEIHSAVGTEKEGDGCLTMTLTGNMTLKLKYESGGQEVVVGFNDHFLNVQLADGTELRVPIGRPKAKRKAA